MDIREKVIVVTGGGGALGSTMANGLALEGAKLVLLGIDPKAQEIAKNEIIAAGGIASSYTCNVLKEDELSKIVKEIIAEFGKIDGLINAAGGNMPGATVLPDGEFNDISTEDMNKILQLNIMGTVLPTKVISKVMINQKSGSIINISSMAASRPLTRVVGYSASKAAIDNFTKWMAVELATKHGEKIRVNAIAPGFFIGKQNEKLLLNEDGTYTDRAKTIINHTPMRRFGEAKELIGVVHWLMSDASQFVTGIVVPIDGGFSAFSGV